jgi:hypothetical protein
VTGIDIEQMGYGVSRRAAAPAQEVSDLLFVETIGGGKTAQGAVPHSDLSLHLFRVQGY